MALSKAKKQRLKRERQGKWNPELNRLSWNGLSPVEKKSPTLAQRKEKLHNKHQRKWNLGLNGSDGSILHINRYLQNREIQLA
jgi:hypothetical protein